MSTLRVRAEIPMHLTHTHTGAVSFCFYVGGGAGRLCFGEVAQCLVFGASARSRVGNICMCVSMGV